jgi:cysteine sulfinate desulfinase/cysteine desulfurase-like protein
MMIVESLAKHYPMGKYESYIDEAKDLKMIEIVVLGCDPADEMRSLPNTLLLSIAKNKGNAFCNIKFKELLRKNGIDISIGSACHTDNPKASHVLTAIHAPPVIKKGVIRISLGDYNTVSEIKQFITIFLEVLDQFIIDLDKSIKDPKKKTSIRDIGLTT